MNRRFGILPIIVLAFGVAGVSTGAIFARQAQALPLVIAAYRLGIASAILVPCALLFRAREIARLERGDLAFALGSGAFLAMHFATWITSLSYTTVASSVVLVNTIPIWVGLASAVTGVEKLTRSKWLAVGLSVVGACVVGWGDFSFDRSALHGDLLAVAGAICAAGYIICGRRVRAKLSLLPYIAICYGTAAILVWIAVLALGLPISGFSAATWRAFVGMALVAQIIGHSSYNWALKYFSAAFVAIALLGEPIGSSLMAYFLFDEAPTLGKAVGLAAIMGAVVIAAMGEKER